MQAQFPHSRDDKQIDQKLGTCSTEQVHVSELQNALKTLAEAIRQTEVILASMRSEHDPLAAHIFVSRRHYRNMPDTKSGSRREVAAQLSWQTACDLGFRGTLGEWERLLGAIHNLPWD